MPQNAPADLAGPTGTDVTVRPGSQSIGDGRQPTATPPGQPHGILIGLPLIQVVRASHAGTAGNESH
ncbi:hypothetical protein BN873_p40024 [Candidatus Competibacter denitrificans Run_A_D11]|uniref:Uncharacterized protein n=1 Tax=Candidatus Competibacter denitrificans Run_A_D11 TaxID=1400863 RepID=W6MC98_9GAMM|nr:hypothetical protein BN873_p40024 [Candidatus Competibacter denitrificans Run_A_D11]